MHCFSEQWITTNLFRLSARKFCYFINPLQNTTHIQRATSAKKTFPGYYSHLSRQALRTTTYNGFGIWQTGHEIKTGSEVSHVICVPRDMCTPAHISLVLVIHVSPLGIHKTLKLCTRASKCQKENIAATRDR